MAVYKSTHKGSQIDNAVSAVLYNEGKGSNKEPVALDEYGRAYAIEVDNAITASSIKSLVSGGAYNGLNTVIDKSDVQYEKFTGEFEKHGNVSIIDGVASGFSRYDYLTTPTITLSSDVDFEIEAEFTVDENFSSLSQFFFTNGWGLYLGIEATNKKFLFSVKGNDAKINQAGSTALQAGATYKVKCWYKKAGEIGYTLTFSGGTSETFTKSVSTTFSYSPNWYVGVVVTGADTYNWKGSVNLNELSIKVGGKVVYTPYPNSALPPSQYTVKQYVDETLALKQNDLRAGYGIDIENSTVSVSTTDVFREGDDLHEDLKVDHFGDMSVGSDSEMLAVMDEARHSSFDHSKFTVAGSPTITDNGIASGFSASNYLQISKSILPTKELKIKSNIVYSTQGNTSAYPQTKNIFLLSLSNSQQWRLCTEDQNKIKLYGDNISTVTCSTNTLIDGDIIDIEVIAIPTQITLKVSINGVAISPITSSQSVTFTNITGLYIGSIVNNYYFTGSIDLKQFSITVDGVPVFSGNKTGVDTLKPSNFTAITTGSGSPFVNPSLPFSDSGLNISVDGVVSGFDVNKYIKIEEVVDTSSPFRIEGQFNSGIGVADLNQSILTLVNSLSQCFVEIRRLGLTQLVVVYSDSATTRSVEYINLFFKDNTDYYFAIDFDGTNVRLYMGNKYYLALITTVTPYILAENYINLGVSYSNTIPFNGSIDLSAFKIYVDGKLVYQPCLRVPYTLTKDGKKIVDYKYSSCVEDMYNQAGYAPYYTLQEENKTNYAVVGSPVIADGIASGFSNNNHLVTSNITLSSDVDFEIEAEFTVDENFSSLSQFFFDNSWNLWLGIEATNKKFVFAVKSNDAKINPADSTALQAGETYRVKCWYKKEGQIGYTLTFSDGTSETFYDSVSETFAYSTGWFIGVISTGADTYSWKGSVNLNAFKVYVNNELVYRATTPPNYTLATVEEDDIVRSYIDGANAYTQKANQELEIQGTCTANTAVTFPNSKAFMDTNYALSIPYVSGTKTKTGFTPAIDGDYIAEGFTSI